MNKTLMAILSASALLVARPTLARRPDPGAGYGHSNGPRPLGAPCQRGGDMGRGAWNGDGDLVAAHLDPMARRLNLTSEQKAKLEPIIRQRQELRAAQRQAVRDEVAVILTPGQIAQFDQMGPGRGAAWGAALVRDGVRAGRTRDGTTAGRRIPRPRPLFQCRSTQTLWLGKGRTRMTRTTHGAGRT